MTNPFSGIITTAFKDIFTNAIDALLEDAALTVPCRLIYSGTKFTLCYNCLISPITGRSTNIYNGTGGVPFAQSTCPVCGGVGRLSIELTEDIYLAVIRNYKDWVGGIIVDTPEAYVQTISVISTLDQIKRANQVILNTDITNYAKNLFIRYGEPMPVGFSEEYIFTMWKKV